MSTVTHFSGAKVASTESIQAVRRPRKRSARGWLLGVT